jgi:hypothetical protein
MAKGRMYAYNFKTEEIFKGTWAEWKTRLAEWESKLRG